MAHVQEFKTWYEGIYRLELDDPMQGGYGGVANRQAVELASRTAFLKEFTDRVPALEASRDLALQRLAYLEQKCREAGILPPPSGVLVRTSSGLLALHDAADPLLPFAPAEWSFPGGADLAVQSDGALRITTNADTGARLILARHSSAPADRAQWFVSVTMRALHPVHSPNFGPAAGLPPAATITEMAGFLALVSADPSYDYSEIWWAEGGQAGYLDYVGTGVLPPDVLHRVALETNGPAARMYDATHNASVSTTHSRSFQGAPGFFFTRPGAGEVDAFELVHFAACTRGVLEVSGLGALFRVDLHDSGGTLLRTAQEQNGVAALDLLQVPAGAGATLSVVSPSGDLITSSTPAGGIWPGDVWAYEE